MFKNIKFLTDLDLSSFNTEKVDSMSATFYECSAMETLDIGSFDCYTVKHAPFMFAKCSNLKTILTGPKTYFLYITLERGGLLSLPLPN